MARYLPLFALHIDHEFFGDGENAQVFTPQIEASKACAAKMEKESLLVRTVTGGIEVWQEQLEWRDTSEVFDFEFLVSSSDPNIDTYTAWDIAKPICYQLVQQNAEQTISSFVAKSAETEDFGLSSFERQRRPILFSVKLPHALTPSTVGDVKKYQIQLRSKHMHWKYYFSGALAKKKLEIVDLDANSESDYRFIPSRQVVIENSLAFVSEVKLPMRSIPPQRFQLREEDANGRVLMRRLPNASIDKIGKEKGPDGQSLVVAEIYIHQ
ncbi:hypothetical protein H8K35_18195 [Undibacterium sp. LX40W]|uniref:Uncharacterized protein n=1 Tax=Undibacterium nitidum TaxID=2762298 RepID=A0A923HPK2_9BURK|nr:MULTISPECIES: hypothetical protein [Undibacterium]MBC3883330.1 hypothetical protein [Undibacterium nitidum]MBC3893612.1 hypothetical protein [Undibacterium sp. LX40W]